MTNAQKIQVRQSEVRQSISKLLDTPEADRSDTFTDDLAKLSKRASALETELQAALLSESEPDETRADDSETPEGREIADLSKRASIGPFLLEAAKGHQVDGAEHEYRQALLGDEARAGLLPVEMLLTNEAETRADTATAVPAGVASTGTQAAIMERVFNRSIAARLGVAMPTVAVGTATFPIFTAGTTAKQKAAGAPVDAEAGTLTAESLRPTRLTARYLFRIEDTYVLRGYEQALRRDLSATMSDAMDGQIVNGNGTAPNVTGFLHELTAPTDPTDATDYKAFKDAFLEQVDGLNAFRLSDVRAVLGAASYRHGESTYRNTTEAEASLIEHMGPRLGGLSVSARIPAPASNIQTNVLALTSYPGRNAAAPVWRALELIRDPYGGAASGEVAITAVTLWNFKILREAGWALFKIKTA